MQHTKKMHIKQIDHFQIALSSILGRGKFGSVYKAYSPKTDEEAAVKVISKKVASQKEIEFLRREIEVLKQLQGDHVVKLLYHTQTENNVYLFLEFCDGGCLEDYMKKMTFSEIQALGIIKQITAGILSIIELDLRDKNGNKYVIYHRDLKPANILLSKGKVKIGDFGFAKFVEEAIDEERNNHTVVGSPAYLAPEIFFGEMYNHKCDIWSAGIILFELLFGRLPWIFASREDYFSKIKTTKVVFPKIPALKEETMALILGMLELDAQKRLTWNQIYDHPAMKDIKV